MSEPICKITWLVEDLEKVFNDHNIPFNEENIANFLNSRAMRTLEEQSVACGWDVLSDLACDFAYDNKFRN